jgi:hypothetical protein
MRDKGYHYMRNIDKLAYLYIGIERWMIVNAVVEAGTIDPG